MKKEQVLKIMKHCRWIIKDKIDYHQVRMNLHVEYVHQCLQHLYELLAGKKEDKKKDEKKEEIKEPKKKKETKKKKEPKKKKETKKKSKKK